MSIIHGSLPSYMFEEMQRNHPRYKRGVRVPPFDWRQDTYCGANQRWKPLIPFRKEDEDDSDESAERRRAAQVASELQTWEQLWPQAQRYLEECGYLLRPRYLRGWTPSFGTKLLAHFPTEDSIALPEHGGHLLIDAIRLSDGVLVQIQRIRRGTEDARLLTLPPACVVKRDIQNHYTPVLDVFEDERDQDTIYVVTPFLRPLDSPPFETFHDVVSFTTQVLEGLSFIHERGVAHGNIISSSIKVDAQKIFPDGFHPVTLHHSIDCKKEAWHIPRILFPHAVRYYFVDFDLCHVDSCGPVYTLTNRPQPQTDGSDFTAALRKDILDLGRLLEEHTCNKYANVEFVRPLVALMTNPEATQRPDIAEVVEQWRRLRRELCPILQVWRLRLHTEGWWLHFVFGIMDLAKLAVLFPASYIMHYRTVRAVASRISFY